MKKILRIDRVGEKGFTSYFVYLEEKFVYTLDSPHAARIETLPEIGLFLFYAIVHKGEMDSVDSHPILRKIGTIHDRKAY